MTCALPKSESSVLGSLIKSSGKLFSSKIESHLWFSVSLTWCVPALHPHSGARRHFEVHATDPTKSCPSSFDHFSFTEPFLRIFSLLPFSIPSSRVLAKPCGNAPHCSCAETSLWKGEPRLWPGTLFRVGTTVWAAEERHGRRKCSKWTEREGRVGAGQRVSFALMRIN